MRAFFRCLAVVFVISLVSCVVGPDAVRADDAVVFNALDKSDPLYAEYQRNLCAGTYQEYQRFFSERFWLDQEDPKLAARAEVQRQDWVINYVITTSLRDSTLQRFDANCR